MINKYNISRPEKYIDKAGVEKTKWNTVGVLTEFEKQDGSISRIVEIPAIGLKASVFLQEPRENAPRASQPRPVAKKEATVQLNEEYPEEDKIVDGDIPF